MAEQYRVFCGYAIKTDADDGHGWQTYHLGDNFSITYATAGKKNWRFDVELSDGSHWHGNGGTSVVQNDYADIHYDFTGTTPYEGTVNSAHISIDLAPGA